MTLQLAPVSAQQVVHQLNRVLIADDNSIARDTLRKGVKLHTDQRYLEISIAKDGNEALEMLQKKRFDLAFLDINMPGMGAPELISTIKETASKNCMIVVVSTNLDHKSAAIFKKYQAYHFITKPFRTTEISDVYFTYLAITRRYSVVIVDDSATMRKLARKVFEASRFSFDIKEAGSAEEAINMIIRQPPQIVVTDFHMPNIDGLELAGAIHNASDKIAIYLMSTTSTSYLERSAAFVGVTGFLGKPFYPEDVDSIMHKLLELDKPKFGKTREMFSFLDRKTSKEA
nr:response regulator [uncultured Cohaesibacter sp.]